MKYAFGVLVLAAFFPVAATAQSASLAPGARVRVTAPNDNLKRVVGTVAEVRNDSILLVNNRESRAVALANVTSLEVSKGQRSMFLRDAGLGLGIGAVAGYVMGYATYEECNPDPYGFFDCMFEPESRGQAATWGGLVGGALGLVSGALVGAFHRVDRWESLTVPPRVTIRPGAHGITVGISRAF